MKDAKPISTPLPPKHNLHTTDENSTLPHCWYSYGSIFGSLQYLTVTRPGLACAVNLLFQYAFTLYNWWTSSKACRTLCKRNDTLTLHPNLRHYPSLWFSDAALVGCPHTRRSTLGCFMFVGSNCDFLSAKPTMSWSNTKLEYRTMAIANSKLTWLTFSSLRCWCFSVHFPWSFIMII